MSLCCNVFDKKDMLFFCQCHNTVHRLFTIDSAIHLNYSKSSPSGSSTRVGTSTHLGPPHLQNPVHFITGDPTGDAICNTTIFTSSLFIVSHEYMM